MSSERPIFDVEGNRPSTNVLTEQEIMQREKIELSQPIPPQSRENLLKKYPDGQIVEGNFVVEREKDRFEFDKNGREIVHTSYKRLTTSKPSEFDVQSRVQATYDERGYIHSVTSMEVGKLGFKKYYHYKENGDDSRELSAIVFQPILRQGLMDPGPAVGDPLLIDFSTVETETP